MFNPVQKTKENTFQGNCDICGRKDTAVHFHHLIPQRLLDRIPIHLKKRWSLQKVKACNSCDSVLHPENKLYQKIVVLEKKLRGKTNENDTD
jgi:hypothetical protein